MVQTGDPTGTGKGGNSIWGKKFADELRGGLKVTIDRNDLQANGVLGVGVCVSDTCACAQSNPSDVFFFILGSDLCRSPKNSQTHLIADKECPTDHIPICNRIAHLAYGARDRVNG